MTVSEFDEVAANSAVRLETVDLDERIASACRGSGNPAALAWLAEGCGIGPESRVVDLGSGLGGPAAWLSRHYHCSVIALEPATGAAFGAARLFDAPVIQGDAAVAPLRSGSFDVALLLGVLSVAADPDAIVAEAERVATTVGVLDYCSTGLRSVAAGGSRFLTVDDFVFRLERNGLTVATTVDQVVPAPPNWVAAGAANDAGDAETEASRSEHEVVVAIESGALTPCLVLAHHG